MNKLYADPSTTSEELPFNDVATHYPESYVKSCGAYLGRYVELGVPHDGTVMYEFEAWYIRGHTAFIESGEYYGNGMMYVKGRHWPKAIAHDYFVLNNQDHEFDAVIEKLERSIKSKPTYNMEHV